MKTIFGMPRWMFWTLLAAVLFTFSPFAVKLLRGEKIVKASDDLKFYTTENLSIKTGATLTLAADARITYSSGLTIEGFKFSAPVSVNQMTGFFNLYQSEIQHAEKPEEITVTLTTKDGRKWRAKWEEVKP